ncbi:hypothetical protein ACNANS_18230 [Phocaeicola vulgatus]|jgi:hypothetical protein|uniref:hypothetical protein n=1 Tax=Phocaeicola vulgatus TaxID=821 RepID=UPI003AB90435
MKISPDYTYQPICHFCHKNLATKEDETYRNLYYIEKASHYGGVYHSARYYKLTVAVPTCKECNKTDTTISRICFFIGVIIFLISTYIWSGIFAETDYNFTRSLKNILIACLPSFLITLLVGGAIAFFVRLWLETKWKRNSYCDDYSPIKKLIGIGFEARDSLPNLKNTQVQGKGYFDMGILREVVSDITINDHCFFTK